MPHRTGHPTPGSCRLIYDGDCGFCTRTVQHLMKVAPAAVSMHAWQETDLAALGIADRRAQREMLWIDPTGRVTGGALAFAGFFRQLGWHGRLLEIPLRVPPTRWLALVVYRLVAVNRHRMPGESACALPVSSDR